MIIHSQLIEAELNAILIRLENLLIIKFLN
jgi:hypothetical protein